MKRNLFIALAVALILSGCASPNETYNALYQQQQTEDSGWDRVAVGVREQCGYEPFSNDPPPKKEAVKRAQCVTTLVNQYVMPVAAFPDVLKGTREKAEYLASEYAKGAFSGKEYLSRLDQNAEAYHANWNRLANQKVLTAAEQQNNALMWAGAISNVGATSYQYRQETIQQQAAGRAAAYEASRSSSVVCRPLGYGGRVECYEQ